MYRATFLIAILACLPAAGVSADPIHAVADGAYWHHESGWVFPETIGDFERAGIPQDVAGSDDAVAHYACMENGTRHTASVDVYRASSAAAVELEARSSGPSSDTALSLGTRNLSATRQIYDARTPSMVGVYFIDAGEWRVRIRITGSQVLAMDTFVRGQRWETLAAH